MHVRLSKGYWTSLGESGKASQGPWIYRGAETHLGNIVYTTFQLTLSVCPFIALGLMDRKFRNQVHGGGPFRNVRFIVRLA